MSPTQQAGCDPMIKINTNPEVGQTLFLIINQPFNNLLFKTTCRVTSAVRKDTNNNRYCSSHFAYFFICLHNLLNPCLK